MSDIDNVNALLAAGKSLADELSITISGDSAPVLYDGDGNPRVLPFAEVEKWMIRPFRKRGEHQFADADSFIRFFNEHKTEAARVFAAITDDTARFSGVLNFHSHEAADWNDFRCNFNLQPTREWETWTANASSNMTQSEFAAFLETNADLFTDPSGAALLEIIQSLEGHSNAAITSAVRLNNGQINVSVQEEVILRGNTVNQEAKMELPSLLKVSIMPFHGTAAYPLSARLRYRIADRKLTFWYEPINHHLVVRQVASDILLRIEKETGVSPFKV